MRIRIGLAYLGGFGVAGRVVHRCLRPIQEGDILEAMWENVAGKSFRFCPVLCTTCGPVVPSNQSYYADIGDNYFFAVCKETPVTWP